MDDDDDDGDDDDRPRAYRVQCDVTLPYNFSFLVFFL